MRQSYLCQALGNAACRKPIPVRYTRLADICDDLNRSRAAAADSYNRKKDENKTVRQLIIDAFMTTPSPGRGPPPTPATTGRWTSTKPYGCSSSTTS